ncbi:hypothetical protein D1Y85_00555 [Paraburkholderia dinghuensis]|uniref:Uncharacterized protein n=1 Tax=Paraburkholderia dinghuensis TaxID=2305225 RepID=A0A3N6P6T0_9BURK|nr:hypothetical protein [Paraburkholderia dinghuensis]RQH09683.1 hypothetical protein D1Y85_00555 [Paraburkholderia dinghuensis]
MTACNTAPAHSRRSARVAAIVCGCLAAGISAVTTAQQVVNPGDIIVERDITPRSAFASVPKSQDPVVVRATTFPANTFDPTMAAVVSDTELTNAHGSAGVAPGGPTGANAAGMQALSSILTGRDTGSNVALGASGQGGGIGGMISSTMAGALAPLSAALGAAK